MAGFEPVITGGGEKTNANLSQQKRADILAAALSEFESRGYRETSVDRIAEVARVSKRTVYNHFASKELLFDEIAVELIDRVRRVGDHPYVADRPLDQQLRAIGAQILDMLAAPCFQTLARVTLVEMIRSPDLAKKTYALCRERQSGLGNWLRAATEDGRLAVDDIDRATEQFVGLINQFALWPQILGGQGIPDAVERARILDSSVAMFLGSYARPPAAG